MPYRNTKTGTVHDIPEDFAVELNQSLIDTLGAERTAQWIADKRIGVLVFEEAKPEPADSGTRVEKIDNAIDAIERLPQDLSELQKMIGKLTRWRDSLMAYSTVKAGKAFDSRDWIS